MTGIRIYSGDKEGSDMAKRLKWGTIEYLEQLIEDYFDDKNKTPTLAGLCLHLNISRECWNYYVSEKWKTFRKSEEEIEAAISNREESLINEAFEELVEISDKGYKGIYDNIEDDNIKAQVSDALKKAHLMIDKHVSEQIFTAKNPAGAIFYAKAALGYRETAPEATEQANRLPTTINIVVLPQPERPKQLDTIPTTTYSVLPDKGTD